MCFLRANERGSSIVGSHNLISWGFWLAIALGLREKIKLGLLGRVTSGDGPLFGFQAIGSSICHVQIEAVCDYLILTLSLTSLPPVGDSSRLIENFFISSGVMP